VLIEKIFQTQPLNNYKKNGKILIKFYKVPEQTNTGAPVILLAVLLISRSIAILGCYKKEYSKGFMYTFPLKLLTIHLKNILRIKDRVIKEDEHV